MPKLVLLPLLAVMAFAVAGCEDDDGDSGSESVAALSGELFTQTAHSGSLTPVPGQDDVFTLTLDDPAPNVTAFTDRPARRASTEPLADFVDSWAGRGFEDDPPNAALVLDQAPDDADTAVYTLADPKYDRSTGSISYTATHIQVGTGSLPANEAAEHPPKFDDAHLFIDPSGGNIRTVAVDVTQKQGARLRMNFSPPWTLAFGAGESGIGFVVAPNVGGGEATSALISLTSSGSIEFAVTGGTGPITGTAVVPSGAKVQAQVDDGPEEPIKNGAFSIGGG